ncbi:putative bifunctional diguanylate cyclase/phosphodiesterase [Ilumatobacter sp.]|uniref:putative bifunctional diguanylate cyclase/phosphodiesterase n=1 Tax=Ilumatobacter sp. TaxID=1967498 RepID=UPI003AF7460B
MTDTIATPDGVQPGHPSGTPVDGRLGTLARWLSPRTRVLLFAALLAAIGGVLLSWTPLPTHTPDRAWALPWFALVVAFGIAEATALHVEIRKESHSLSLSGIPMMFGLLFVSPLALSLAYLCGAAPAMLFVRKSDVVKTTWNLCLFFAEAALAAFILRHLLGLAMPSSLVEWMVPLVSVLAAELLSLVSVSLVIMVVDVRFRPSLFADVGQSQILAALAGTFTVTAMSASVINPAMILFAIVPVIGVGALMQSSGQLSQRHKDLQQLHGFTRALTNERGPRTVDTGLAELVQIMRSRSAGLLIMSNDPEVSSTLRVLVDDTFHDLDPDAFSDGLIAISNERSVTEVNVEEAGRTGRSVLQALDASKLLAIKVLTEVDRVGVLFVADRLGMRSEFASEEFRLFGSLANTLSARLSNDHLVAELETQAQHDALTGLSNRLTFEVALTASLSNPDHRGVVLMIDLDRFKEINDSLGHDMGDRLLIEVARRLRAAGRSTDLVARFGGDEFAMLLSLRDTDTDDDVDRRLRALHESICAKFNLEGITFEIGASLGVVSWPELGHDSATILRHADTAMYEAKRQQAGVVWYEPALDADAPRRLDLYLSARAALESGDLFVHYQPKISTVTGGITGAEALARWTHQVHGDVPPSEFVPLLAQAGLIGHLTRFVIEHGISTAAMFRQAGIEIPIAVNLTPRDLLDPELPDDIAEMLTTNGVPPGALHVEITEDAMVVDFDTSVSVLSRLRELGVRVAIDDFGTGYSSLQHLHRLPVDQLKIDRSFVSRMSSDDRAAAIVRASINLAGDLGLATVAEGIDDPATLRIVTDLGCDEVQGFLIQRPMDAQAFLIWALAWDHAQWTTITTGSPVDDGGLPPLRPRVVHAAALR